MNNITTLKPKGTLKSRLEWDCIYREHGPLMTKEQYFAENRKERKFMEMIAKPYEMPVELIKATTNFDIEITNDIVNGNTRSEEAQE